ncbi:hypothetical protein CHS0354_013915 [Potamilus streckersoni]|uniref:Antistasin-like domain-containing protein n=1 Tax=Potamilus streckersoni TaxID=2493646 RepID=A0AAE0RXB5_9BIVA|nr:hypothetical protein CHS0354_013915 [Potamilus streckersoni]
MQSPFHLQPGHFGTFGVSTAIPIVDQAHITLKNPCIPSQSVCLFNCTSGYVQGPSGCHYCACTHDHTETTTRSNGVTLVLSLATTKVPTVQMTTVNTICEDAKTLCDLKCAGSGYFVDHDDCTSCICKSDITTHSGK